MSDPASDSAMETAADGVDLELHLGLSRSSNQPTKGGSSTAASGLGSDLALFTAPSEIVVEETKPDPAVKLESVGSADTPPPTMADLGVPSDQDPKLESKDFIVEQPITGNNNDAIADNPDPIPDPVPDAIADNANDANDTNNPNAVADNANDANIPNAIADAPPQPVQVHFIFSMVVPAWVREELLPQHGLPSDLPLFYVGEKILCRSDLDSRLSRLLIPADASFRLRLFLTTEETIACGFHYGNRDAGLVEGLARARRIAFDGIRVLAYGRAENVDSAELKLSKFHHSDSTVINGKGYRHFMLGRCGFVEGDAFEMWAFRRPPGDRLCLLIYRRDDDI